MFVIDPYKFASVSYVNSVQQVSITIGSGATNNTATITSIDTSKSWVIFQGCTGPSAADAQANTHLCRVELTNSTTITAYRDSSSTDSITVNAVIIEGNSSLISSVQTGTITTSATTSNTATISAVTTSRSAVFWLGNTTTNTATNFGRTYSRAQLTNSTTVTATNGISQTSTTGYVVVEFSSSSINLVQPIATSLTNTNTSDNQTITSVSTSNSMIAHGGFTAAGNAISNAASTVEITSSTNVNTVRGGTSGAANRVPTYTVIEFASGVIKSTQRGTIALTSVTSNTATISSIGAKGFANFTGYRTVNTAIASSIQKISLTNATTVTASVNTSSAGDNGCGYEAIEFN